MASYYSALTQHVTCGGTPVTHRIGNPPSPNKWGGDAPPPPPPPDLSCRFEIAPVPYDVPRLPPEHPGLAQAGDALADLYRSTGVVGGGGGILCGRDASTACPPWGGPPSHRSSHLISHPIPYHTTPYHTIPYHTIPHHTTPYHPSHTGYPFRPSYHIWQVRAQDRPCPTCDHRHADDQRQRLAAAHRRWPR
jgi:hypothetical protein